MAMLGRVPTRSNVTKCSSPDVYRSVRAVVPPSEEAPDLLNVRPVELSSNRTSASCPISISMKLFPFEDCIRDGAIRLLDRRVCVVLVQAPTTCRSAGWKAGELFNQGVSYTYDDVILHPGHIDFGAHEVRTRKRMRLPGLKLFA